MTRVAVSPELLRWACTRAGYDPRDLAPRFPQLRAWESGEKQPTLKQLEAFAKATHVPFGYFFLPEPPDEPLPISDFRAYSPGRTPSGDLIDTVYAQQRRQDWFQEYATIELLDPVGWIGSAQLTDSPMIVGAKLRKLLDFEPETRRSARNWVEIPRLLSLKLEALGVLVTTNGVVGTNTHRPLDPNEFRGFCIADDRAPLIFVNGADHKGSQAFTLCHELAHLVLGQSGLSDEDPGSFTHEQRERWCDDVASEILVPMACVESVRGERALLDQVRRLSRELRVSPLVTLRRAAERAELPMAIFRRHYEAAIDALPQKASAGGGDFYAVALTRVGRRFAESVLWSTLGGTTTYTEAFRLLGVRGTRGFDELAQRLGFS